MHDSNMNKPNRRRPPKAYMNDCTLLCCAVVLPGQRVIERVERDRRRDALDAEPPDVIIAEETESYLLHGMPDYCPVVRHALQGTTDLLPTAHSTIF